MVNLKKHTLKMVFTCSPSTMISGPMPSDLIYISVMFNYNLFIWKNFYLQEELASSDET